MTTNNAVLLEQIKAKIALMKAAKTGTNVEMVNLEEAKRDIHVAPSPAQIRTYLKLCTEKHVQLDPKYRTFDGRKNGIMDKEIQRLIKLVTFKAPSEAQINILEEICARNSWEVPEYKSLTGGREGTFSKMIGELINMERELQKVAPPTENQVMTIVEMYHCPDVDFSDLNESYGVKYIDNKGGKLLWSRPSQETIIETILDMVTYQEASAFIYKFQSEFYAWKSTRLSDAQMVRVKANQKRCGMEVMSDAALMQFDRRTADIYIRDLDIVRRDADLCKFPVEAYQEDISRVNTVAKAVEEDVNTKDNILFSLYAMCGMSGSEESDSSIDLSNNYEIIKDLAQVVVDICGIDSVIELLSTVYSTQEVTDILTPTEMIG